MIQKPIRAVYDPARDVSRLFFDENPESTGVEYRIRGGICFPKLFFPTVGAPDIHGFAVLSGEDVVTREIVIFEQTQFSCIDPIVEDGLILINGIAQWLNKCWSRYYAKYFFWSQDSLQANKYRLDISRSVLINPKPGFVSVGNQTTLGDLAQGLWSRIKTAQITWEQDSEIHKNIKTPTIDENDFCPSIHALVALIAGIDKFPYKKRAGLKNDI